MAAIRITGMASGLPPNIVDQLIEAERIPIKTLEASKGKDEDKLKLVTDLETKVSDITKNISELVGTRGFTNMKLASGDPNIIDGVVDPEKGGTGDWALEVLQLAQKAGAISNGFPDKDKTEMGVGYIKLNTPEGQKEVYISGGGTGSTLEGVSQKINASGLGLRATVINDRTSPEEPFRLMITGLQTGTDNTVEFPTVYLLDGDQDMYFDQSRPSQNAKVKLDGFEIELPDNSTGDLIPGVTLDLKQAAPGKQVRINVKEDLEVISGKIKTFVDAYNAALQFIQDQHKLQKGPDGKQKLGPLGGDGMLRTLESNLRRIIIDPQYNSKSQIKRMTELGVEFNRNGTLNLKKEKFDQALAKNPQDLVLFLRGDGFNTGFVSTLRKEITNMTNGAFGPLSMRKKSLNQKINQANQRIENKERQIEKKEDSLRRKFADLETKMSKLNAQGGAVGAMAGGGGGGIKQG